MSEIKFGTVISAVGEPGASDSEQYVEALVDADHVAGLGYDAFWVIEHHFSDYFPTPSPLVMLSHLAGRYPDMDLGTCVLVLPWYSPLRLAGEIAMLSQLSRGTLHIGFGRGLARLEYDAFGVSMSETRARFRECREVIGKALAGGSFTYDGEFFNIERSIELRPKSVQERINLYGATSSPESAGIMAELDLPMIRVSNFPMHFHGNDFARWDEVTRQRGGSTDVSRPILIHAVLADTDEEADALRRRSLALFVRWSSLEADADPGRTESSSLQQVHATSKEADNPGQSGAVAGPPARRPGRDRVREAPGLRRPWVRPLHPAERDLRHAARLPPRDVGALRPRRGAPLRGPTRTHAEGKRRVERVRL